MKRKNYPALSNSDNNTDKEEEQTIISLIDVHKNKLKRNAKK